MKIDYELLKCSCSERNCPVFSKCCFLPTECHPDTDGNVSLLFIGQGGGSDERKQGRPFIGRAGSRLRQQVLYIRKKLKKHIGVAFSNTIRDNPDGNRVPTQKEYDFCLKHLYQDIALLKKRGLGMIIPLGNASKLVFMPGSGSMRMDHGKISNFSNVAFEHVNMMPTYHPSFVIRNAPKFNDKCLNEYDIVVIKDIMGAYRSLSVGKGIQEPELDGEIDVSDVVKAC
jgi:uracil-DNA glycosylase family 4